MVAASRSGRLALSTFLSLFFLLATALGSDAAAPALPLHTQGRWIVDRNNTRVKLASVNWFGADEREFVPGGLDHARLDDIARQVRAMGFNSVRLLWANETLEKNPVVPDYAVRANPQFRGKRAMEVFDAVVKALAREKLLIVLDNHVSRADWCCSETDGNGLWYSNQYPETAWIRDWETIVRRYKKQPHVVGVDLRNELRSGARWGGENPLLDWRAAAQRAGNAILRQNPNLLIVVEGTRYSLDFTRAAELPVRLSIPNRLVYSPHNYGWSYPRAATYEEFAAELDRSWGYLLRAPNPVPMWLAEFGVCHSDGPCRSHGVDLKKWFPFLIRYLRDNDLDWAYWPLNGTQSSGAGRKYDTEEGYGLLNLTYSGPASTWLLEQLQSIQKPSGLR